MPRGQTTEIGTENVAQNGYTWVKTETGWKYKHVLVAEKKLGRPLEQDERVAFVDHDRNNFDPKNIIVTAFVKKNPSLTTLTKIRNRLGKVEERVTQEIQEIRSALDELEAEISSEPSE